MYSMNEIYSNGIEAGLTSALDILVKRIDVYKEKEKSVDNLKVICELLDLCDVILNKITVARIKKEEIKREDALK